MKVTKKDLKTALESIKGIKILVVGDLILDRYIWGSVDRISPEAPVPVVEVKKTDDRLGGAGNTVRNLTNLGVNVSVCGFVGDDAEGTSVLNLLESSHIAKEGILVDPQHVTSLKTRIIAQSQQIVRIDREQRVGHSPALREKFASAVESQINSHNGIIVSDYAKGAVSQTVMSRLEGAHNEGRLSINKIPLVVDPHPDNFWLYSGISVAKPNRKEAELASGMKITNYETAFAAGKILLNRWNAEILMITLGEDGMIIVEEGKDKGLTLATTARNVFDVSGAGDTVTAVFTAALAAGNSPQIAGVLSNIAAGIVVSEVGTVPITKEKLIAGIDDIEL